MEFTMIYTILIKKNVNEILRGLKYYMIKKLKD